MHPCTVKLDTPVGCFGTAKINYQKISVLSVLEPTRRSFVLVRWVVVLKIYFYLWCKVSGSRASGRRQNGIGWSTTDSTCCDCNNSVFMREDCSYSCPKHPFFAVFKCFFFLFLCYFFCLTRELLPTVRCCVVQLASISLGIKRAALHQHPQPKNI